MECRQRGLSDYQWCKQNDLSWQLLQQGTQASKIRYSFPDSEAKSNAVPNIQEAVKVDLFQPQESGLMVEQNVNFNNPSGSFPIAAELFIGGITLRLYNGA